VEVAIVTSSLSCLPAEQVQRYSIKVVPIPFCLNGHAHLDGADISSAEVYRLLAYELPFRTSAPSPGDYLKAFQDLSNWAKGILCLTIPRRFSMMADSAQAAAAQMPVGTVRVLDTGAVAGAQALIDMAAARAAFSGANLEEVTRLVERLARRVYLYGLIVAPQYVTRTGRVPSLVPKIASVLGIKPVIICAQGHTRPVGVVRTERAGVNRMLTTMREKAGQRKVHVIIQHADAAEQAENLRRRVESEFTCNELHVTDFSPVMGFATGPGTLALAFYAEE
jgi:DegV family protein with EDD domain